MTSNNENLFKDKLLQKLSNKDGLYSNEFDKLINDLFTGIVDSEAKEVFRAFSPTSHGIMARKDLEHMWTNWLSLVLDSKTAFLIVDVQNDFISGSLALDNLSSKKEQSCAQIIPLINSMIDTIPFEVVVYTLDWHPPGHISFADCAHLRQITQINGSKIEKDAQKTIQPFDKVTFNINGQLLEQVVYPSHCVKDSWGAQLHEDLKIAPNSMKIYKGTNPDVDSYSGFKDNEAIEWTDLDYKLKTKGITDVYICGLAYDICVYHTALDALSLNYRTLLVEDCCEGTKESEVQQARKELEENGCLIVTSTEADKTIRDKIKSWKRAYELFKKLPPSVFIKN
ncbi:uncharacterized protein LOC107366796 [Tetranychus urticae]|uniref:nicotinamidase n=1 Tax=Tetranychus urticae TaxID=32264 RepID=T1KRR6_TETUR|nr:uncharacterized protein LOC107366796 [Tetranychus urticae]